MVASGSNTDSAVLLSPLGISTLTVSSSLLEKDLLLQVLVKIATPLLKVHIEPSTKKSASANLSLNLGHAAVLKQRNAIIRALAGPALFYALDETLLGGRSTKGGSNPGASVSSKSCLAMAAFKGWMSQSSIPSEALVGLDQHLDSHAFLLPSTAKCTLADYHVSMMVLEKHQKGGEYPEGQLEALPNLLRWLRTCHAQLQEILGADPATLIPPLPDCCGDEATAAGTSGVLPIFYNGTEDVGKILSSMNPQPKQKKQSATDGAQNNCKKGNQAQQQQGGNDAAGGGKKKQQQQKEGSKKQQGGPDPAAAAEVTISVMDLRVGEITKVWNHEEADKLFCEEINLGDELGTRQVASGLREYYKVEDMQGRKVVVLCNLKKRNLVGFPSHGMVLCAVNSDKGQVQLVSPPDGSNIGDRVSFEGYEAGQPEPENKVNKKKMWEQVAPYLKTNDEGQVTWKDSLSKVQPSGGVVTGMPNSQVS